MNGLEIVESIEEGYASAVETAHDFLGVEPSDFNEPELRPEYLVTISIAKAFNKRNRHVRLEAPLKPILNFHRGRSKEFEPYTKKERFDLTVSEDDNEFSPETLIEIKLNNANEGLVTEDLNKLARVLNRFDTLKFSDRLGVFLCHFARKKSSDTSKAETLLGHLENSTKKLASTHERLNIEFGFLIQSKITTNDSIVNIVYDDGSEEDVLGREGFIFTPGIILLSYDALPMISLSKDPEQL
ncbi:MAG: hypothetical protein JJ934_03370 [Pseudomonadales bacterium]|nr:hypothetical protein [Pseudomonadales bacterium]